MFIDCLILQLVITETDEFSFSVSDGGLKNSTDLE